MSHNHFKIFRFQIIFQHHAYFRIILYQKNSHFSLHFCTVPIFFRHVCFPCQTPRQNHRFCYAPYVFRCGRFPEPSPLSASILFYHIFSKVAVKILQSSFASEITYPPQLIQNHQYRRRRQPP